MKTSTKPERRRNPYLDANLLSRVFHWYLNPLFREGYRRRLGFEDVPDTLPWDKSEHLADQLETQWNKELARKNPNLAFALLRMFWFQLFIFGIDLTIMECLRICQPLLITLLLDYFQGRGVSRSMAYFYGTILGVSGLVFITLGAVGFHLAWCIGMRAKAATSALIYRKMMSLKMGSLSNTPSGKILNHMATDVEKFQMSIMMIHFFWIGPLQLVIVAYLLFLEFGRSFLAGLGVFLLFLLVQQLTSRIFGKMKLKVAEYTDKRTHLMNEIIAGMRVIKMYCWEQPYTKIIAQLRKQEIRRGVYAGIVEAENYSFNLLSAKLVTFVTVAVYVMTGNILTPQNVFKLVAWTEVVRFSVTFALTMQMLWGSQGYFAAQRIQKFLASGEVCYKDRSGTKSGKEGACDNSLAPMPNRSGLTDSTKLCLSDVHASWPEKKRDALGAKTDILAKCRKVRLLTSLCF